MTYRFQKEPVGFLTKSRAPRFTGDIQTHPDRLDIPLRRRKPTVFAIWNDLFHEDVPDEFRDAVYGVMALCPQHTFLVLTKRADRMAKYWNYENEFINRRGKIQNEVDFKAVIDNLQQRNFPWPLPNVWHGLTICNQPEADEKIPELLKVPGKKFISYEPALGGIDFEKLRRCSCGRYVSALVSPCPYCGNKALRVIHAVILGGETGPGARPMHPDWVRSVRDQCQASGTSYFFKQWGEWAQRHDLQCNNLKGKMWHPFDPDTSVCRIGSKRAGRTLDGREWDELPWRESCAEAGK